MKSCNIFNHEEFMPENSKFSTWYYFAIFNLKIDDAQSVRNFSWLCDVLKALVNKIVPSKKFQILM